MNSRPIFAKIFQIHFSRNFPAAKIKCYTVVTTIGCCYRAEKGKDHSLSIICDSIDKVTNPNCILLGDFNFPNVNWSNEQSSDILSRKFIDTLQRNFWTQRNYSPTRKTNILDLVITNNTDCI